MGLNEVGASYRRMLAGAFLFAARCAMALPAPAGAPSTSRGCAAPSLMEFAGELLVAGAVASREVIVDTSDGEKHGMRGGQVDSPPRVKDSPAV